MKTNLNNMDYTEEELNQVTENVMDYDNKLSSLEEFFRWLIDQDICEEGHDPRTIVMTYLIEMKK